MGPSFFTMMESLDTPTSCWIPGKSHLAVDRTLTTGFRPSWHLSTNILFYAAYTNLVNMTEELGKPVSAVTAYESKAVTLKDTINERFW